MELNLSSKYNPTGDPLFYMPQWMRITELIAGNSETMAGGNSTTRNNSKPVLAFNPDGSFYGKFHSVKHAGADLGFPPNTLRERIKTDRMPYKGYYWRYDERT